MNSLHTQTTNHKSRLFIILRTGELNIPVSASTHFATLQNVFYMVVEFQFSVQTELKMI